MLLMLACAGAQLALGESLVATALELGIFSSHPHAHSVVLKSDGNHFDVVLSHGERHRLEHGEGPSQHVHRAGLFESDHVVHITAADALNASPRRAVLAASHALASSIALAVTPTPAWAPAHSFEPRPPGTDLLRTVVLRL